MIKNMKLTKNKKMIFSLVCISTILILGGFLLTSGSDVEKVQETQYPKTINEESTNLDEAISLALLNSEIQIKGSEVITEGHIILDKEEADDKTKVYILSSTGSFGFENGIFTLSAGTSGLPMVMNFSKDDKNNYHYIDKEIPMDGSYYMSSIKEIFPQKLWKDALDTSKYSKELMDQQEKQATEYLESISRKAKVQGDYVEKKLADINVDASNELLQMEELSDYPYWIGTREELIDNTRYIYEKAHTKEDGYDYITYTKTSGDKKIVEEYKYKINGSNIELIN